MKTCKKCGLEKQESEFRTCRGYLRSDCRECERKLRAAHYAQDPEKFAAASRKWSREHPKQRNETKRRWRQKNPDKQRAIARRAAYGISQKEFDILYSLQEGRCAICSVLISDGSGRKGLAVDHCHSSEEVRGLLCAHCNRGLGGFRDNPEWLRKAAAYIEKHR